MLLLGRISVFALALLTTCSVADAGLCDCLFGRNPGYSAGYGSYPTPTPYAAGYGGVTTYPVAPATSYYAGPPVMTGGAVPAPTANLTNPAYANRPAFNNAPAVSSGVVQAQRPAYPTTVTTYNNPSVYTGLPVTKGLPVTNGSQQTAYSLPASGTTAPLYGQTPYQAGYGSSAYGNPSTFNSIPATTLPTVTSMRPSVPIASTLRGSASTSSNPFYGTGNIYPSSPPNARPTSIPYQAGYGSVAPAQFSAPIVASPPTGVTTLPIVQNPNRQNSYRLGSGLSRFFDKRFGGRNQPNYYSSYYSAPITYYRPATTFDPTTGTTVTTQQACSSYVQQLQRTPYNSFQLGPAIPPTTQVDPGCNTAAINSVPLSSFPSGSTSPGLMPPSGQAIGQVGGISGTGEMGATPIPSTSPYYGAAPTPGPLTGPPAADPADDQSFPPPELKSNRPPLTEPRTTETEPRETQPRTDSGYYRSFGETGTQSNGSQSEGDDPTDPREPESPTSLRLPMGSFKTTPPIAGSTPINPAVTAPELPLRSETDNEQDYSDIRPIGAPEDFRSPFENGDNSNVPLLPAPSKDTQYLPPNTSNQVRLSVPVRPAVTRDAPQTAVTTRPSSPVFSPNAIQRVDHQEPANGRYGDYDPARRSAARAATAESRDTGGWKPTRRRYSASYGN